VLRRPDGAEIHWEATGDGPLVVLSPIGYSPPSSYQPLLDGLAGACRLLTYDLRGTGASTGDGPYDIDTDAGDLAAVVEAAGGAATAVCMGDGCNRAIRAAAGHPGLFSLVLTSGAPAVGSGRVGGDSLAGSPGVLLAFFRLFESDYRAAVRSAVAAGSASLTEEEVLARVDAITAYAPHSVALERLRAWIGVDDRGLAEARALGDRLVVLHHDRNPWFSAEYNGILRGLLPDAEFAEIEDGALARPDITVAEVLRRLG